MNAIIVAIVTIIAVVVVVVEKVGVAAAAAALATVVVVVVVVVEVEVGQSAVTGEDSKFHPQLLSQCGSRHTILADASLRYT